MTRKNRQDLSQINREVEYLNEKEKRMAKLTITVGDKMVWRGMANSVRVDSDVFSVKTSADLVIEVDTEPDDGPVTVEPTATAEKGEP